MSRFREGDKFTDDPALHRGWMDPGTENAAEIAAKLIAEAHAAIPEKHAAKQEAAAPEAPDFVLEAVRKAREKRKYDKKMAKVYKAARKVGMTVEQFIAAGKADCYLRGGPPITPSRKSTALTTYQGGSISTAGGISSYPHSTLPQRRKTMQQGKRTYFFVGENPDGTIESLWEHEAYSDYQYELLVKKFGEKEVPDELDYDGKQMVACWIPADKLRTRKCDRKGGVASCAYEATDQYMKHILGGRLHADDMRWYKEHPLTQAAGLPMPYTLRVLQELIEPYGLRIARVRARAGLHVAGDLLQWQGAVLGCNPLASMDLATTNAAFAEATGQTVEAVDDRFRFEFNDEPLQPGICCEATMPVVPTGQPMGHAIFAGPRTRLNRDKIWLSVQMARAEKVRWDALPIFPNLGVIPDAYEFDIHQTILASGASYAPPSAPGTKYAPSQHQGPGVLPWHSATITPCARPEHIERVCRLCWEGPRTHGFYCAGCWAYMWSSFICSIKLFNCKHSFKLIPPRFVKLTLTEVHGICPSCNNAIQFSADTSTDPDNRLVINSLGYPLTGHEVGWWRRERGLHPQPRAVTV